MYKKLISASLIAFTLLFVIFYSFFNKPERDITPDLRAYFQNEEKYVQFLKENVKFKTVKLEFLTIQSGENFWKIARDNKINIDTLIGANIFWEDLKARMNQNVVVPSHSGAIEFVYDIADIPAIAETHGVEMDDIEIQKLPFFYSFYGGKKDPIAVFIKDVRPRVDNMTAALADKFKLRQMFRSPLGGRLSSFYGNRRHPVYNSRKFHNGLDIAAPHGTLIGASRAGVVVSTGWMGGYGKAVIVQHDNGYKTMYGHMSQIYAKNGEYVKAGKILGRVGSTGLSTGPHLHFTLWHNGRLLNPMNVLW